MPPAVARRMKPIRTTHGSTPPACARPLQTPAILRSRPRRKLGVGHLAAAGVRRFVRGGGAFALWCRPPIGPPRFDAPRPPPPPPPPAAPLSDAPAVGAVDPPLAEPASFSDATREFVNEGRDAA